MKGLPQGPLTHVLQANIAFVLSSMGRETEASSAIMTALTGMINAVGDGHTESLALIASRARMELVRLGLLPLPRNLRERGNMGGGGGGKHASNLVACPFFLQSPVPLSERCLCVVVTLAGQVWGRFTDAQKMAKHLVARARKANDDALQLANALLLLDDVMSASPGGYTSIVRVPAPCRAHFFWAPTFCKPLFYVMWFHPSPHPPCLAIALRS